MSSTDPWSVQIPSQSGGNQLPHNPFASNYSVGSVSYPTPPTQPNLQSATTTVPNIQPYSQQPAIASPIQYLAEPAGSYEPHEPTDTPFDPNHWISTVMSLSIAKPVDGTLAGLIRESESFQLSIVDKIPLMRQKYSTMFSTSMFDSLEARITKRNLALQSTVSSLCDFEMVLFIFYS